MNEKNLYAIRGGLLNQQAKLQEKILQDYRALKELGEKINHIQEMIDEQKGRKVN